MIKRRFLAYIYDVCILVLILLLTSYFLPVSEKKKNLSEELSTLEKNYLEEKITDKEFISSYSTISYEMDKENVPYSIMNVLYVLLFFIYIPLKNDGMTIGGSKLGVRIKKNKGSLTTNDLVIRNTIVNGLAYMLLSILLLYFLPKNVYFYVMIILGFIQFTLVIISAFMVLYRHDRKGLQDLFSKSSIEEKSATLLLILSSL